MKTTDFTATNFTLQDMLDALPPNGLDVIRRVNQSNCMAGIIRAMWFTIALQPGASENTSRLDGAKLNRLMFEFYKRFMHPDGSILWHELESAITPVVPAPEDPDDRKIVIECSGGVIRSVYVKDPLNSVMFYDWDEIENEEVKSQFEAGLANDIKRLTEIPINRCL